MSLYESIFKRKSLRKYSMISLDEETIHKVNSMMRNLPVLEKSCSMDLVFIRDGDSLAKKMSPFSKVLPPIISLPPVPKMSPVCFRPVMPWNISS